MLERVIVFLSLGLLACHQTAADQDVVATVADFRCLENSYRSTQRVATYSEVFRARLLEIAGFTWVDRSLLDTAIRELEMSMTGMQSANGALSLGRLVRADLIVDGTFCLESPTNRLWRLDVIDVEHADILATRTYRIAWPDNSPLPVDQQVLDRALADMPRVLHDARAMLLSGAEKTLVAPVFFANRAPGERLDFLELDLLRTFETACDASPDLRCLRFPRASEALGEAELVAFGLATAGNDVWRKMADVYVWGEFWETGEPGQPFDEVPVGVEITLWDGVQEPRFVTRKSTAGDLKSLLADVVTEAVTEACKSRRFRGTASREAPTPFAGRLLERARDMQYFVTQISQRERTDPSCAWHRRRAYVLHCLDLAALFAPTDEEIRTELHIERTRDDLPGAPSLSTKHFCWRSRAWKQHCEAFGFGYQHKHMRQFEGWQRARIDNRVSNVTTNTALIKYFGSALEVVKATHSAAIAEPHLRNQHPTDAERLRHRKLYLMQMNGAPPDTPPNVLREWEQSAAKELLRRIDHYLDTDNGACLPYGFLLDKALNISEIEDAALAVAVAEKCFPAVAASNVSNHYRNFLQARLRKLFQRAGQSKRAEVLIATLSEPNRTPATPRPTRESPGGKNEIHQRQRETEEKEVNNTLPRLAALVKTRYARLKINANDDAFAANAMARTEEHVWFCLTQIRSGKSCSFLARVEPNARSVRLFDGNGSSASPILSLAGAGRELWAGLSNGHVWRVKATSGDIRKFGERDGLALEELHALCVAGGSVFVGGGQRYDGRVFSLAPGAEHWASHQLPGTTHQGKQWKAAQVTVLEGGAHWTLAYANSGGCLGALLRHVPGSATWTVIARNHEKPMVDFKDMSWPHLKSVHILGSHAEVNGCWFCNERGFWFVNARTGGLERGTRTPCELTAMVGDESHLWFLMKATTNRRNGFDDYRNKESALVVYDKLRKKFVAQMPLPKGLNMSCIEKAAGTLWLSTASPCPEPILMIKAVEVLTPELATWPVGQKKPNTWGLYDMSGNVAEWCSDKFELEAVKGNVLEVQVDPTGPDRGGAIFCGGGAGSEANSCRSAYRRWTDPKIGYMCVGLRLVRSVE